MLPAVQHVESAARVTILEDSSTASYSYVTGSNREVTAPDSIDVTIADPKAYAKPWTVSVKAELAPDTEMIEFVCGEKNADSLAHWVGKASDERKDAVSVPEFEVPGQ